MKTDLSELVRQAQSGEADALETLVAAIQNSIYSLAVHMLWHPDDARDATQEILIRVITHLSTFRFDSSFQTWVYRVAANHLRTVRKVRMERVEMTFDDFGRDLAEGLATDDAAKVEEALLVEEVKIGCTLGMLLCLTREHRLAFILGEIMELDSVEGAEVLQITPAAFRQRLARARAEIISFTRSYCGIANPDNPCRCSKRVSRARDLGRVNPLQLLFASNQERAAQLPNVLDHIRDLDESRRAVAMYRAHAGHEIDLVSFVRKLGVISATESGRTAS